MNGFLISGFLLSLLNLAISTIFKRYYPKEINDFVGYRTPRSMRSQEAWDFANRYSSALLFKCAVSVFFLQFLLYAILEAETAMLTFVGLWIGCLVFTILRTEKRLKKERL
jgi:uncharacterized membrane protein